MKNSWERLITWMMALAALIILPASVLLIFLHPAGQDERVWEFLSGAVVGCVAPILGLVILKKQSHNRIGWLWLIIGLAIAFGSLSQGLKYRANSNPIDGYSSLLFTLMLFSETVNIIRFICLMLVVLWFPDGKPPTPRWRILHWWTAVSFILLNLQMFAQKVPWSNIDGVVEGAPLVNNPIGFIPLTLSPLYTLMAPIGFFSIVGMLLLAVLAMRLRYHSAGQQLRAQIRWFVVGGVIYAASFLISLILLDYSTILPGILTNLATLPFYLAIGIAITRYKLYDVDLIIRKTLLYSGLTAALGLVYFGSVLLLQQVFRALSGQQSPAAVVFSTLVIVVLFNPMRQRLQIVIDRRFFRQKYDAEKTLADFNASLRQEVNLEKMSDQLLAAVVETVQPEHVSLWRKSEADRHLVLPTRQE